VAGIPFYLLKLLHSMRSKHQKFGLITLFLHEIHCWNPTVHRVEARCPHLHMSAQNSISLHLATEPHQWVDLAPRAFSTCLDRISDRLPYMSLNSRWSSFPITGSYVWNALLQYITSAHSLPVFSQLPEDLSLHALLLTVLNMHTVPMHRMLWHYHRSNNEW